MLPPTPLRLHEEVPVEFRLVPVPEQKQIAVADRRYGGFGGDLRQSRVMALLIATVEDLES